MATKTYRFFCQKCCWRKITDGTDIDKLYEYKLAAVPGGAPKLDPITKKTVNPKTTNRRRVFRCPSCGAMVSPTKINNPQAELDEKIRKEKAMEDLKTERDLERQRTAKMQEEAKIKDEEMEAEKRLQRKIEAEENLKEYDQ